MLRAAIEGQIDFEVEDCELKRPPPSYSIDTVLHIRERDPNAELFWLIGADNVGGLTKWHRIEALQEARAIRGARSRLLGKTAGILSDRSAKHRHLRHRNSETELRPGTRFAISYRRPWRKLFSGKIFTGSQRHNREKLATTCAELASNKKAEDIVVLDLRRISSFTDFFVICSATSEPQLKAIANEIETRLREDHGIAPPPLTVFRPVNGSCSIISQVVVHIFHRDKREFYSLEDLWGDAARIEWETVASASLRAEALRSQRPAAESQATAPVPRSTSNYFADGAGAGLALPLSSDFTPMSSTSKISVEFGGSPGRP